MRKFFFIPIILLFLPQLYGQKEQYKRTTDSCFLDLQMQPNTEEKVGKLIVLFKEASKKKYLNYKIIDEAIKVSEEMFYIDGIVKSYNQKAIAARFEYDFYKSITNHKRALNYADKTTDTLEKIKCLNSLGVAYRKVNIGQDAFKYYFQAYNLSVKMKDEKSKAISLNGIGNIFTDLKKHKIALYYFKKAVNIEKRRKNNRGIEYGYANIGEVFMNLEQYDSAQIYIDKALEISLNNNRENSHGPELSLLGALFQKKKEFKKSDTYYLKAVDIFQKRKNPRYLSNALINLGINKIKTQNPEDGFSYVKAGLTYAKKIHSKENILLGYNTLIEYYTQKRAFQKALEVQKLAIVLKDSILNESSQKNIISSQIAYEAFEKDQTIRKLAEEKNLSQEAARTSFNKLIYSTILGLLTLIISIIFFFLYRRNTQLKIENLNSRLQNYVLQSADIREQNSSIEEKIASFELSERESEVLNLIVQGLSNNQISAQLFISNNTVKYHSKNIYSKLDVKNRIQAMKKVENI